MNLDLNSNLFFGKGKTLIPTVRIERGLKDSSFSDGGYIADSRMMKGEAHLILWFDTSPLPIQDNHTLE